MSASRPPLWERAVTYGTVGATQAADLLRFPPAGFRAIERRVRIGHGAERWEHAWVETMSWGITRRSGFRVEHVDAPAAVMENSYTPVTFDDAGEPVQPATLNHGERVFAAGGAELVRPGDTAVLRLGWGAVSFREPVRVVSIVDEPTRRGFAYGTLPGHPLSGEESFVVEHRDDDSVWLTIRSVSRPANVGWWLLAPLLRLAQWWLLLRYERALTGPPPERG